MAVALALSLVMMVGLFLMIVAAVAFIQDKRMFTSAPKDIQEAIRQREGERFPGAHALGWILLVVAILMIVAPLVYVVIDGVRQGVGFWPLFARLAAMLLALKAFDILFQDWYLLCHSHFYQHFYPETEGCTGFHSFGFNARSHVVQALVFVVVAAVVAGVCALL